MANWLQLNGTDIVGWQTGKDGPNTATRVAVSDATLAAYVALRDQLHDDGRADRPQWTGTTVVDGGDTRPLIRVTGDRAINGQVNAPVLEADGVDTLTITLEKMMTPTTVDTAFTATRIVPLATGGFWRVVFTAGVATKLVTATASGRYVLLRSNATFKLSNPIIYVAVE